jgi:nicotinate-nucleotide adenylyltransferase
LKRIGLFGGTFNPIHLGHIQVIQEVKKGFGLDKIFIIPSALPPHKEPDGLVEAADRIEMIRLAFSNHPDFAVSDVELKRPGPSYTIDTVRHFKSILSEDSELFLIMGLDAFLEIDTWKSYKNLFLRIPFIVMSRSSSGQGATVFGRKPIEDYLKSRISEGYKLSASQSSYVHEEKQPVYILDVTPIDISSTKIRKFIKTGRPIKSLVPEIVEGFIKSKGLYL